MLLFGFGQVGFVEMVDFARDMGQFVDGIVYFANLCFVGLQIHVFDGFTGAVVFHRMQSFGIFAFFGNQCRDNFFITPLQFLKQSDEPGYLVLGMFQFVVKRGIRFLLGRFNTLGRRVKNLLADGVGTC